MSRWTAILLETAILNLGLSTQCPQALPSRFMTATSACGARASMSNFPLPLVGAAFLAQQTSNDPLPDAARLGRISDTAVGGLQLLEGETLMVDIQNSSINERAPRACATGIGSIRAAVCPCTGIRTNTSGNCRSLNRVLGRNSDSGARAK